MTLKTKDFAFSFEQKTLSEDGSFEGYASVFGVEDFYGDVVVKGAFTNTLAKHKAAGTLPAMLWQHNAHKPIGVYTEMREDDKGLYVKGKFVLEAEGGKAAYELLKAGAINGLSIGFHTVDSEFDEKKKVRNVKEIDLWEVSLVTFPASDVARVDSTRSTDISTPRKLEKYLRESGLSREEALAGIASVKQSIRSTRDACSKTDLKAGLNGLLATVQT